MISSIVISLLCLITPSHKVDVLIKDIRPAMIHVESRGNPRAIGKKGERGILQIMPDYWTDGTKALGVSWDYEQGSFDRQQSFAVSRAYLKRYARSYECRTGKPVTREVLARIHNGGPYGYRRLSTARYWKRVERRTKIGKQ